MERAADSQLRLPELIAALSLGIDLARWYRDGGTWTPESLADFYADLALRVVGARP